MQAEKKARNEKFIFPHVEVLFIFMLFHVGGEGKGGRGRIQNIFCCFMSVLWLGEYRFSLSEQQKVCAYSLLLCHSSVNVTFH